jgi:hypothetical protein
VFEKNVSSKDVRCFVNVQPRKVAAALVEDVKLCGNNASGLVFKPRKEAAAVHSSALVTSFWQA